MRLRGILENEELKEMQMLKDEEKVILSDLADSKDELAQQTQLVGELISEVERRLLGSKLEMLQVRLGKKPQRLGDERNAPQVPFFSPLLPSFCCCH